MKLVHIATESDVEVLIRFEGWTITPLEAEEEDEQDLETIDRVAIRYRGETVETAEGETAAVIWLLQHAEEMAGVLYLRQKAEQA